MHNSESKKNRETKAELFYSVTHGFVNLRTNRVNSDKYRHETHYEEKHHESETRLQTSVYQS